MPKANPAIEKLAQALAESIEKNCNTLSKAAVLFSGGVDSALVAKAVSAQVPHTSLFVSGFPGSSALSAAERGAKQLRLPLRKIILSEKKLKKAIPKIKKIIKTNPPLHLQIALPIYFAMQAAKKAGFKHVFTGMGADELFLGYDYFRRTFNGKNTVAIKKLQKEKLSAFWKNDFKRDSAIAKALGLRLHAPFLFPAFMKAALALPVKRNLHSKNDVLRKHALRSLALYLGIPQEIAFKRKKAVQYDSGVSKRLKKMV
ncbi:MAG: asparagine synthase-related protein [Candidatus Diapherotrites archaeon]|nr:asparagine synthase-related protein [Candidatus Diapherotrites archaeon]